MPRTLLLAAAALGLSLTTAQAQSTFQGIQGEQIQPAPAPSTEIGTSLPESPGLSFDIGKPTPAELSKIDGYQSVEQTGPFFRSTVLSGHRIRRNGVTGLDIFDQLLK